MCSKRDARLTARYHGGEYASTTRASGRGRAPARARRRHPLQVLVAEHLSGLSADRTRMQVECGAPRYWSVVTARIRLSVACRKNVSQALRMLSTFATCPGSAVFPLDTR